MKQKLIIVTGNPLKFRELSAALEEYFDCEQKELEGHEIQESPEEILKYKLKRAYEAFGEAVLVDDTSVHFDELKGFPGPYIKDFLTCFSPYEMGVKFEGSRIKIVCRLGICTGEDNFIISEGTVDGVVIKPKKIDPGDREFDLFVLADGTDKPMIEFTPEEKNKFSHRGQALRNMLEKLRKA